MIAKILSLFRKKQLHPVADGSCPVGLWYEAVLAVAECYPKINEFTLKFWGSGSSQLASVFADDGRKLKVHITFVTEVSIDRRPPLPTETRNWSIFALLRTRPSEIMNIHVES